MDTANLKDKVRLDGATGKLEVVAAWISTVPKTPSTKVDAETFRAMVCLTSGDWEPSSLEPWSCNVAARVQEGE